MTGRYPLHTTVNDWLQPQKAEGLPLNETLMPQILAGAGYEAHAAGKWHLGFYNWAYTPTFRGFRSFLGFYSGGEHYFTHEAGHGYDFRRDMGPRCGANCSQVAWDAMGKYSTTLFSEEAVRVVDAFDGERLFLYLAYQAVHAPSEVPARYRDAYNATIEDEHRRTFAGMLSCMDEGIGNVTAALKAKGLLDSSLIVFTTDNGGPTPKTPGGDYVGSRNYPLRGGKHSIWEGGTRGTSVVWAGADTGLIPASRRGATFEHLMHAADWLPTLCGVAGLGQSCGPSVLDGVDQGGGLFGAGSAPPVRDEVLYGQHDDAPNRFPPFDDALRDAEGWKLIQGWGGKPSGWSMPVNASAGSAGVPVGAGGEQQPCTAPCCGEERVAIAPDARQSQQPGQKVMLFNVMTDPQERDEVAADNPEIVARLAARLDALRATAVDVPGGGGHPDPRCGPYNMTAQNYTWSPWC